MKVRLWHVSDVTPAATRAAVIKGAQTYQRAARSYFVQGGFGRSSPVLSAPSSGGFGGMHSEIDEETPQESRGHRDHLDRRNQTHGFRPVATGTTHTKRVSTPITDHSCQGIPSTRQLRLDISGQLAGLL